MNIRAKLILSYALVIALCLGLAALVSTLLLRRYQHDVTVQRLADIAEPVALILHEHNDPAAFDAGALLAKEADQTGTRMLLLRAAPRDLPAARAGRPLAAVVAQDTAGQLPPGATVQVPREVYLGWSGATPAPTPPGTLPGNARLSLPKPYRASVGLLPGGQRVNLAAVPLRAERGSPGFRVLVVLEREVPLGSPLARLAPSLGWAALLAFLVAILIALLLARSITRPLLALSAATRALAAGDYARRVPVQGVPGRDEVAQLATSFNAMAREIERARRRERDLLANVSHDLKTPLTSIRGFAGALVDGTCPPDAYPDVARIIHEEARRMDRLVGELLELARLEAGELPLAPEPIELAPFLQACARRFAPAATEAGVELVVDAPPDPLRFEGDRARLEQALGNLLDNALRHTPPGGRVALAGAPGTLGGRGAPGRPAVRLAVRDTGAGIPPEDLPRIFERFYQADKARAAGRGGSGLGLAIAKGLVESHGGAIRADSTRGAGTTITITLPLAESGGRVVGRSGGGEPGSRRRPGAQAALHGQLEHDRHARRSTPA